VYKRGSELPASVQNCERERRSDLRRACRPLKAERNSRLRIDDEAIPRGLESVEPSTKEAVMPLARVVSFDGVSSDRMAEMQREMQDSNERPENVPAKEIVVLHDPDAEKSLVILFFENDDDYRRGDETLSAMPAGDTPGQRTSVTKYQVAFRMTD
jgi:hypothetical protein